MKERSYSFFFKGKKPTKKQYYLITFLAWIYVALAVALIIWIYEASDMSTYLKFIIVTLLMIFTPSFKDLFQTYSSFIKQYYEGRNEEK